MPVFKKKRVTTQANARRVAEESKASWVSKFTNEPSFRIDVGIWARLTRTIIRRGRYIEDPAAGEKLHFESHPFDIPKAHGEPKQSKAKSGE